MTRKRHRESRDLQSREKVKRLPQSWLADPADPSADLPLREPADGESERWSR
jgi:hypothetical protein